MRKALNNKLCVHERVVVVLGQGLHRQVQDPDYTRPLLAVE